MYKIIMIIQCIKCGKKFEVNSDLIPQTGRTIQCGSCNHIWFYKIDRETAISSLDETSKKISNNANKETTKEQNTKITKNQKSLTKKIDKIINNKDTALVKYSKKNKLTFIKIFRYFLVLVISIISLIIILDTFKYNLSDYFPNLELLLYNFYQSLIDIYYFTKDLIR